MNNNHLKESLESRQRNLSFEMGLLMKQWERLKTIQDGIIKRLAEIALEEEL